MDAKAHLISLGWMGPGHALDSKPYKQNGHRGLDYDPNKAHNTGNGLVKPLLISQNRTKTGIGKKVHEAPGGNDWWLKGFETALSNIGKSDSERSSGMSTPVGNRYNGKHAGLYGYFVKGQQMSGTIGQAAGVRSNKKRKSDGSIKDQGSSESSEGEAIEKFAQVGAFMAERDKGEQRRQRETKTSDAEQFAQIGQFFAARSDTPRKKTQRPIDGEYDTTDTVSATKANVKAERKKKGNSSEAHTTDASEHIFQERKEERRERRRKRKEELAAIEAIRLEVQVNDDAPSEDDAARAARQAERRRRKEDKLRNPAP